MIYYVICVQIFTLKLYLVLKNKSTQFNIYAGAAQTNFEPELNKILQINSNLIS